MRGKYLFILLSLCTLCLTARLHAQDGNASYLDHLFAMQFRNLRLAAVRQCTAAESPLQIDAGLFRLADSAFFMEDTETVKRALITAAQQNEKLYHSPFYPVLHRKLSVTGEETGSSATDTKNLLRNYFVSGPGSYTSRQSFSALPLSSATQRSPSRDVTPDKTGTVNMQGFSSKTQHTSYQLHADCTIRSDGDYILLAGKSGFAEIYIDGKKIAANYDRHEYFPVQYYYRVHLEAGSHTFTLKTAPGRSSHKAAIALIPDSKRYTHITGNKLHTAYSLYNPQSTADIFHTAYILHKSGLTEQSMAPALFSSMPEDSPWLYPSLYYRYLDAPSATVKLSLLKQMKKIKEAPRIRYNIARLYASSGRFQEAFSCASRLGDVDPAIHHRLSAIIASSVGWNDRALAETQKLHRSRPDTAALFQARLYRKVDQPNQASVRYTNLLQQYRDDTDLRDEYITFLQHNSLQQKLQHLLYQAVQRHPENSSLRLTLAHSLYNTHKINEAVTVLSAFTRQVPHHPEALYLFSRCYLAKDNRSLAQWYAHRASALDPDNREIAFFIENNFRKEDYLHQYTHSFDQTALLSQAQNFQDEPAVLLYSDTIENLNSDGSSLKRVRKSYLIHDSEQAKELQNLRFTINTDVDEVLSLNCTVTHNNKTYSTSSMQRRSLSDPESRLYYDIELITVQLPVFQDNCTVTYDYTIKSSKGVQYNGYFGSRSYFSPQYRTLSVYNTVVTPAHTRLTTKIHKLDPSAHSIIHKENKHIYTTHLSDIPPETYEPHTVPYFNRIPSVTYSTLQDWDEFHQWYTTLLDDRMICTEKMRQDLLTITADSHTNEEKLSAIYRYITNRTRYVGFETGIGGIQPRSTQETYQSGLGDCKDIALLLAVLLREAGFDAHLALVRTFSKGFPDKDIPYVGNFNHAICYVDYKGGLFLDGTVNASSIYDLPFPDRYTEALVVREEGTEFTYIHPDSYSEGKDTVTNDLSLRTDGSALLKRTLRKSGPAAAYFRNSYTTDRKKIQYLTRYWNSHYPGASVENYTVSDLDSLDPVSYSYTVTIPAFFKKTEGMVFLPEHILPVQYAQHTASRSKREKPLFLDTAQTTEITTTVHLPDSYVVYALPASSRFHTDNFSAETQIQHSQNGYSVRYLRTLRPGIVQVDSYGTFRKTIIQHDTANSRKILIRKEDEK